MKDAGTPKENDSKGQQAQQTPEEQAAEDATAAAEGRMTENQARELLEAMKDEDQRVRLYNPSGKPPQGGPKNFRDW